VALYRRPILLSEDSGDEKISSEYETFHPSEILEIQVIELTEKGDGTKLLVLRDTMGAHLFSLEAYEEETQQYEAYL